MSRIDPHFPCVSPESATPMSIPLRLQLAELEREMHQRRDHFPGRVAKGRMTAYDAERGINMMVAIAEDMREIVLTNQWYDDTAHLPAGAPCAFPEEVRQVQQQAGRMLAPFRWSEIVACLQREIALRRRYYPQWIAGGTLEPMRARHQLERLEAVHFRWWAGAHHFMPDEIWPLRDRFRAGDEEARLAMREACRLHRMRFDPSSDRGAYAPADEQVELAL